MSSSTKNYTIDQIYTHQKNQKEEEEEDSIARLLYQNNIPFSDYDNDYYSNSKTDYNNEINNGKTLNYKLNFNNNSKNEKKISNEKLNYQAPHITYKMEEIRLDGERRNIMRKKMKKSSSLRKRRRRKMLRGGNKEKVPLIDIPRIMSKTAEVRGRRSKNYGELAKNPNKISKSLTNNISRLEAQRERAYRTNQILEKINPFPIPRSEKPFKRAPAYFFTKVSRSNMGFEATNPEFNKKVKKSDIEKNYRKIKIPVRKAFDYKLKKKFDEKLLIFHDKKGVPIDFERTAFSLESKIKMKRRFKEENFLGKMPKKGNKKKNSPYKKKNPAVSFLKSEVKRAVSLPFNLKVLKERLLEKRRGERKRLSPLKEVVKER